MTKEEREAIVQKTFEKFERALIRRYTTRRLQDCFRTVKLSKPVRPEVLLRRALDRLIKKYPHIAVVTSLEPRWRLLRSEIEEICFFVSGNA